MPLFCAIKRPATMLTLNQGGTNISNPIIWLVLFMDLFLGIKCSDTLLWTPPANILFSILCLTLNGSRKCPNPTVSPDQTLAAHSVIRTNSRTHIESGPQAGLHINMHISFAKNSQKKQKVLWHVAAYTHTNICKGSHTHTDIFQLYVLSVCLWTNFCVRKKRLQHLPADIRSH